MCDNIKCDKCRWLYNNSDVDNCSSQSSLHRGIIDREDKTINYKECMDFSPLSEFEDEAFAENFNRDNFSEVINYD